MFSYTNPITSDPAQSMRDYQILKVGNIWYMTGTTGPFWTGPCRGVQLFRSENLLDWTLVKWLIVAKTLPIDCLYNGRFWAPEIHQAQGRFWLTVNSGHTGPVLGERRMDDHGIWLFVADDVTGPYEVVAGPIGRGFKNDASLFTDNTGRSWLYASGGGLWQAQIDLPTGKLIGADELSKICSPKDPGLPDWMIGGIEGPFVIHKGEMFYLFFSAWTRGYEIGVMQSPTPFGPWTLQTREPIFGCRKRRYREKQMREDGYDHLVFTDTEDPFVETGHCAIFEGPDGSDWISCHYFREGQHLISDDPVLEYSDSQPQLGIEPVSFRDGRFYIHGPTFTAQTVHLDKIKKI